MQTGLGQRIRSIIPEGRLWAALVFLGALLALAGAGVWLLRYVTPYGMGMVNDSVGYIAGARNLVAGNGYMRFTGDGSLVPITNYPPMFSLVMASVGLFGLDIVRASRLVNLLCFAVNVLLTGIVVYKLSASRLFGVLGALLFLISPAILQVHSFALTEPLYLALSYGVLLLLAAHLQRTHDATTRGSWRWLCLAVSGLLSSLAFLTRYPGVALYATVFASLVLLRPTWRARITDLVVYLVFSVPGVALWSLRNALVTGNPANRTLTIHPIPADKYLEGLRNFWDWLFPTSALITGSSGAIVQPESLFSIGGLLFLLLLIALLAITVRLMARSWGKGASDVRTADGEPGRRMTAIVFGLYGLLYLGVLVFTLTFLDASPIFEDRILSPFYTSFFVLLIAGLAWLWQRKAWGSKAISLLISLGLLVLFSAGCVDLSQDLHTRGQGFLSLGWRESGVVGVVKEELPGEMILFSNRTQALYLLADRPAYVLVSPMNPATQEIRPEYYETAERIRQMVVQNQAMLIIFDYKTLIENPDDQDWVKGLVIDLPLYGEYWDGAIFGSLP